LTWRPCLRNKHDRRAPVGRLLGGRVENRDLAFVLSGRQAIDAEIEADGHRTQSARGAGNNGRGRGLEELVVAEIETDKGDQRLRGGRTA
jgi:hypothetical protein